MERDMNQSALPTLCRGGCGFYGSPATENLCSKCFKDTLKRKQDPGRISPTTSTSPKAAVEAASNLDRITASSSAAVAAAIENLVAPIQASCSAIKSNAADVISTPIDVKNAIESPSSSAAGSLSDDSAAADGEKSAAASSSAPVQKKNRCDQCRKRVGLTGFECRCGGMFCAIHRYSDMHQCSFDYKALGEQEIRKNNPVVKTEKVLKL